MAIYDVDDLNTGDWRPSINWTQVCSSLLILGGMFLIAWSFLRSGESSSRAAWSLEQAIKYQDASVKLHGLSHEMVHATEIEKNTLQPQLDKAQHEYDALRTQLESAMARPRWVAWLIRISGMLMLAAGGSVLYRSSPNSDRT
jgi:hypothetical protein